MAAARKPKDEALVEDDLASSASADSESSEGSDIDGYEPDADLYGDPDLEDDELDEDEDDDDLPTAGDDDFDDADEPLPEEEDDPEDSEDGPLLLSKDEEFEVLDEDEEDDVEVEGLRDGEFICSDCRMVYRLTALKDEDAMLCRDCV